MSTGYQCRRCGHEPDYNELATNSCPYCSEDRREFSKSFPDKLNALPVGSCVWVWKWSWMTFQDNRPSYEYQRTQYIFEIIGRFEDGSPKWRNVRGRFDMQETDGTVRRVHGNSLGPAVQQYHDLDAMTTKAVAHFSAGELVYRHQITICDPYTKPAPTRAELARERILEAVGMAA